MTISHGFMGIDKYHAPDEIEDVRSPDLQNIRFAQRKIGLMGPRFGRTLLQKSTNPTFGIHPFLLPNGKRTTFSYENAGAVLDLGQSSWLDQSVTANIPTTRPTAMYGEDVGPFTFVFTDADSTSTVKTTNLSRSYSSDKFARAVGVGISIVLDIDAAGTPPWTPMFRGILRLYASDLSYNDDVGGLPRTAGIINATTTRSISGVGAATANTSDYTLGRTYSKIGIAHTTFEENGTFTLTYTVNKVLLIPRV